MQRTWPTSMPENSAAPAWRKPLFADLLRSIRLQSAVAFLPEFRAPWGVSIERDWSVFHIVVEGDCCLQVRGLVDPVRLSTGDFVVVSRGQFHTLRDQLATPVSDFFELVKTCKGGRKGGLFFPGDGPATRLICGGMLLENRKSNPLLAVLPPVLHVRCIEKDTRSWLEPTTRHIQSEFENGGIGAKEIVNRLVDILFLRAVCAYFDENAETAQSGWLAAVQDPQIGQALALLHGQPHRQWTIASLARRLAMSRSTFALRFSELLGEPPQRYFTRLRISAAAARLRATTESLSVVARSAGYESVPAFVKAFKRHAGITPCVYRRSGDRWPPGAASLSRNHQPLL
jgi:AraC-like DNA-binding protein